MVDTTPVKQSWDEFVKDYDFILRFGVQKLQDRLNAVAASQGQTYRLKENDVLDIMASSEIENRLSDMLERSMRLADNQFRQELSPRGDNRPELTNKSLGIEEGLVARRTEQFEKTPWGEKFDIAANTGIQDSFDDFIDRVRGEANPEKRNDLVLAYKMQLKMDMKQRLEERLKPKLDYVPSTPKPDPFGRAR